MKRVTTEFVIVPLRASAVTGVALTASEREIARGVADGRSAAQIARERGTSRRTVEHQIRSLYRKLGVVCRAQLIHALRSRPSAP